MEIHIGDRVADVTLVNKEGNRVELTIDGKPCVVDILSLIHISEPTRH